MTPDQPAAPARLHPETAVICAGRPGHAAGEPLNTPLVLASNFQAGTRAAPGTGQGGRAYSRTDAMPEENATAWPPSTWPTAVSSASQPGVASVRE